MLILLLSPAPPQFQVAQTAIPMGIDPAMLPRLDDTCANTGQVKGGNGQNQDQTLQSFGRRQFTGVDLVAARFLIEKAFFNVKAQAILAASVSASVGSSLATIKAIIWLAKQAGQSQRDWPNSGS